MSLVNVGFKNKSLTQVYNNSILAHRQLLISTSQLCHETVVSRNR